MKLLAAALYLDRPCAIRASVEDDGGHRRVISYTWRTAQESSIPDSYLDALQAECEFQRAAELAKDQGRLLP